tara:strand:- start:26 stop:280 length:255 start_codon:yes stop_codon:yes gene_type:complete
MHFVYVLKSDNHWRFYLGMTRDVVRRIQEHNKGYTKSTKGCKSWTLFFFEEFETREEARTREKVLKSGVGKEYIKKKWASSSAG